MFLETLLCIIITITSSSGVLFHRFPRPLVEDKDSDSAVVLRYD